MPITIETGQLSSQFEAELINRFTYHSPQPEQVAVYEQIRQRALAYAVFLCEHCPESRELSNALTHLDEAVMNANAAIARRS